jgi:hypothetical protein
MILVIFSTADGKDAEYYKAIARYKADGQDQVAIIIVGFKVSWRLCLSTSIQSMKVC